MVLKTWTEDEINAAGSTTKNDAIEIIIGMKRHYNLKKDKHLIDKEIDRLVKRHNITYQDVGDYQQKINRGEIKPYWK